MSRTALLLFVAVIAGGAFLAGILAAHYETFPYPQLVALRQGVRNATGSGPDMDEGARIFRAQCAVCHGSDARGGRGPDLTRGDLSEARISRAVLQGIPGTEMPGSWMPGPSRRALVAYVMSLADPESAAPDPALVDRGRAVFEGRECVTCHVVRGSDIRLGPSLEGVGRRRSAEHLRTSVLEPSRHLTAGFRPVRVRRGGTVHEGFLLHEDPFSVRIRDYWGRLLAFSRREADVELADTSPMPSYAGTLGDDDLEALVAYLASLR